MTDKLAIYIHWPWCKAKCPYCDFNSHAVKEGFGAQAREYGHVLAREVGFWQEKMGAGRVVDSVFFGGGTPSLMGAELIDRILTECRRLGAFLEDAEVTVECNPTSSSETLFKGLGEAGVNRVSVGVQGLQPKWLEFLGRAHSVDEALATLEMAQKWVGNVNADVIYGLPNQEVEEWLKQLKLLARMGLKHVSAYQLTIEPNTRFFKDVKEGAWTPIENDLEGEFFEATRRVLIGEGYENYEISNFARPGFECRHNRHVWNYGDYVGLGAGAHGRVTLGGERIATAVVRQPESYLARGGMGNEGFAVWEALKPARAVQEALFLGLRLRDGADIGKLLKTYGQNAWEAAVEPVELARFEAEGWLVREGDWIRPQGEGWGRVAGMLRRILR